MEYGIFNSDLWNSFQDIPMKDNSFWALVLITRAKVRRMNTVTSIVENGITMIKLQLGDGGLIPGSISSRKKKKTGKGKKTRILN